MFRFAACSLLMLLASSVSWGGVATKPVTTFADITQWFGSGPNEAALVIDWDGDDASNDSLVWGFRWNGNASSEDMFRAVVSGDPKLFARITPPSSFGIGVLGIGYDANHNGIFGITDGTVFPASGLFVVGSGDDSNVATDAGDLYREGWFSGFWNLGLSIGNPYAGGSWESAQTGVSGETLADGDWNSLAFTTTFDNVFASNPRAVVPEASSLMLVGAGFGLVLGFRRFLV
jgi:hypothetical protein